MDGPWCSACGQRQGPLRLPLRAWLRDFLGDEFSLEGRLPRTLWRLTRRPGALTHDWIQGRRQRYLNPLRLYLFTSLVLFAAVFIAGAMEDSFETPAAIVDVDGAVDDIARNDAISDSGRDAAPVVLFLAVPLFALLLRAFFRTPGLFYVDYLVAALHAHSFAFLMMAVMFLMEPDIGVLGHPLASVAQGAIVIAIPVHLLFATRLIFARSLTGSLVRTVAAFLVYAAFLTLALTVVTMVRAEMPSAGLAAAHQQYAAALDAPDADEATALRRQAIVAYLRLESHQFDAHVRYHLANLYLLDGDRAHAAVVARQGLVVDPGDLLLLGAEALASDSDDAVLLWQRFLAAYPEALAARESRYLAHVEDLIRMRVIGERHTGQPR
ncbi:MAG TPA: DUF3667 domain-containing protein [Longimicrobiales bacterium]|nr:DUF3667 domain-containing protein [Longimicrobiales bacterium]